MTGVGVNVFYDTIAFSIKLIIRTASEDTGPSLSYATLDVGSQVIIGVLPYNVKCLEVSVPVWWYIYKNGID